MHVEVRAMRLCVSELERDIRQTHGDTADTIIRAASDMANAVQPEILQLAVECARLREAESEVRKQHGENGLSRAAVLAEKTHPNILYIAHAHASNVELMRLGKQGVEEGRIAMGIFAHLVETLAESDRSLEAVLRQLLSGTVPNAIEQTHCLADDVDTETLWLAYRSSCFARAKKDALKQHGESVLAEAATLARKTPIGTLELAHAVAQLRKAEQEHPPKTPQ